MANPNAAARAKAGDPDLSGAVLTGADLRWAHLSKAMYDDTTTWPAGFDPVAVGVITEE